MRIIPDHSSLVIVKNGVARPMFPFYFSLRARIPAKLLETLKMGEGLPDGTYKYDLTWKLFKGVQWKLIQIF